MRYQYENERPKLFTEEGQEMLLKMRDTARHLLKTSGVTRMDRLMAGLTGDSWAMLACADRLVELHYLKEVTNTHDRSGQSRLFVEGERNAR